MNNCNYCNKIAGFGQLEPIDEIKVIVLYKILEKTCHKNVNGSYYFDSNDEIDENHQYIDKWFNIIIKLSPYTNSGRLRNTSKKMLTVIKYLCKSLDHLGVKFNSKCIHIKNGNKKTTKNLHTITGI